MGYTRQRPQCCAVPAHLIAVFDVVVHQREVVQQLDRGGARQCARVVTTQQFADQQAEARSQALAAVGLYGLELFVGKAQRVA